ISRVTFCTFEIKDRDIYRRLLPDVFPGYVDDTVSADTRGQGRPRKESIGTLASDLSALGVQDTPSGEAPDNVNMAHNASNQLPTTRQNTAMPPPPDTQVSLKRKRGRPPQTPTKGPVSKQLKASGVALAFDSTPMGDTGEDEEAAALNEGYRTMNEVPEEKRTEWIADRAPLFDDDEIAKLCNDPLNETLTPAHVDTILQHVVLFHKRPVLTLSSANSAEFDANLRALGFHQDMSKSERTHLAAAAVPELADGFLFGDTSSYELVILPVYVPGHYVLGIYDVNAANVHYYDSSSTPADYTSDAAEVYLKETVKRLNAAYRPGTRAPRFYRHFDSAYAKQSDGTSCGFYVCYYAEAYLTLRQSTGFFMTDAQFINEYRRRVISVLLSVSTMMFPDYVPLRGFIGTYSRTQSQRTPAESSSTRRTRLAQASQFGMSAVAQIQQSSYTVPSAHPQPSTQVSRTAHVSKETVESLIASMQFKPTDTAAFPTRISPRAMFMYMRTAVSMYQLPVAVASPLLAHQKVFGENAVRDVGFKLHKPPIEAHYVLIPFPLREGDSASVNFDDESDARWILAIHALEKNTTVIYDPTKTTPHEVLVANELNLKKLVVTLRRKLLRTTTATSCSIADARSYSAFSARSDSAFGLLALAECYVAGSVKRLLFHDFAMDKFKNRVGGVFRQLHMKDDIYLKPLPGCRVVLASQQPPVMTADDVEVSANAPRRSTRVIRRSKKDNAAIFTRTNLTLLRPMNAINCNAHKGLGLGCAAQSVNHKVPVYTCGEFDQRCPHCDALLLASEVPRDGNQYTKCCAGGKVDTEYMREKYASLQDMPEPLRRAPRVRDVGATLHS
ncbi:hypothetical protein AAVH_31355, partial [Aphelenchoides avenae]